MHNTGHYNEIMSHYSHYINKKKRLKIKKNHNFFHSSSHNQVTQATTSSTSSSVVQQRKVSGGEPIPGPSSEVVPSDSVVTVGEIVEANGNVNDDDEQPTAAVQVAYQSEEEGNRTNDGSLQADEENSDRRSGGNVIMNIEEDQGVNTNQNQNKPVPVFSESKFGLRCYVKTDSSRLLIVFEPSINQSVNSI